jgi:hypothetical protein
MDLMVHPQAEAQPSRYFHCEFADYRFIICVSMVRSNASTTPPRNCQSIIHEHVMEAEFSTLLEDGEAR